MGILREKNERCSRRSRLLFMALLSGAAFLIPAAEAKTGEPNCPAAANSVDLVLSDMKLDSEEYPHGLKLSVVARNGKTYPTYAVHPRLAYGNHPPEGWTGIQGWGQVYEGVNGSKAQHTLVELRNYRTYFLDKAGKWTLLQSSTPVNGRSFAEDFRSEPPVPGDTQTAADGGTAVRMISGHNFHFWSTAPRPTFEHENLGGLFTTVEARLIPDGKGIDDRDQADYVLSVGADYWATAQSGYDNLKTNGDAGIGRFKKIEACWKSFNMTTVPAAAFQNNPPPLE